MIPRGGNAILGNLDGNLDPIHGHPVHRFRFLSLILAGAFSSACSLPSPGQASGDAIPQDAFINAYVELRIAALQAPDQELTVQARDGVLHRLELQEADLLDFVEVHGKDVQFMRRLWEEADSVLEDRRTPPEPGGPGGSL